MKYTDKELLDFLEELNKKKSYTGLCILRQSSSGRGWRLHETSSYHEGASETVREAIIKYMEMKQYCYKCNCETDTKDGDCVVCGLSKVNDKCMPLACDCMPDGTCTKK